MGTCPAKLHTSRAQTAPESRREQVPWEGTVVGPGREQEKACGNKETLLPGLSTVHPKRPAYTGREEDRRSTRILQVRKKRTPTPTLTITRSWPDVSGFYDFKAVPQLWQ